MASERRVVSQQLRHTLELNWQFVILIASTLLHPERSIISQGESRRKSIQRLTVFFLSLCFCLSHGLLIHLFLTLSYRLNALFSSSLAVTPFHPFLHLWLCFSSLALSPSLSSTQWHLTWQRFPLSKEWNHLSGNGLQPSSMADWRLVSLLDLSHPLLHHSWIKLDWWQVWGDVIHVLLLASIVHKIYSNTSKMV